MRPNISALRIGLFAIVGLAVLVAAVAVVVGGKLFARTEAAVMHFSGSVYGLQVGAPVVFRGVRIGSVVSLGVVQDVRSGRFAVPVVADIDRDRMGAMHAPGAVLPERSLPALVQRGLRAQLLTQSLLTGQLYVDLDLLEPAGSVLNAAINQADKANATAPRPLINAAGQVEIPTTPGGRPSWQTQLEGVDLRQVLQDVAAVAAAARQLVASPETQRSMAELAQTAAALARVGNMLEKRLGPLAEGAQATLGEARRAGASLGGAALILGQAAQNVSQAADKVGGVAGRADALLSPGSPLALGVKEAADELSRSAAALRQAVADDSPMAQNIDTALGELRRTSRSVRELADLLERHPDALLRGRPANP